MLHAADVEALQELKKRSQQEAAQKMELEEQLNKMSSHLQEKSAAWNTLEKQLKVGQLTQESEEGKIEETRHLWVHIILYSFLSTLSRNANVMYVCKCKYLTVLAFSS